MDTQLEQPPALTQRQLNSACVNFVNTHLDLETLRVSEDGRFFFFHDSNKVEVQDSFRNEKIDFVCKSHTILAFQPDGLDFGVGVVEAAGRAQFARLHLDYGAREVRVSARFALEAGADGPELHAVHRSAEHWVLAQQFVAQRRCAVYVVARAEAARATRPAATLQLQVGAHRLDFFTVRAGALYYFDTHRSPHFHKFPADLRTLWRVELGAAPRAVAALHLESAADIPTFNQMNGFLRGTWAGDRLYVSNGVHSYIACGNRSMHIGVFSLLTGRWSTLVIDNCPRLMHGFQMTRNRTAVILSRAGHAGTVAVYRLPLNQPEPLTNLCYFALQRYYPEVRKLSDEDLRRHHILPFDFRTALLAPVC